MTRRPAFGVVPKTPSVRQYRQYSWLVAVADLLLFRWYTRPCRGCGEPQPHTEHLTRIGRWRFT